MRNFFQRCCLIPFLFLCTTPLAMAQESALKTNEPSTEAQIEQAIFAGGCFWCVEKDFEQIDGVIGAQSGFTGGHLKNPTYQQVSKEDTGHYEAVRVQYDPNKVSYRQLVDFFWRTVDVTDAQGQFCDRGDSYRTAIFVTEAQKLQAEKSKQAAQTVLGQSIVTPLLPMQVFYLAEDYHQDYYKKNPLRYRYYRGSCGRDRKVRKLWKKAAGGEDFVTLKK